MSTSHEGVEVAPDGLQFLSDGLEPLDDFDVTVDFAVFVSFDHVARSLQGHASLFHEVIDQSHLFYVSFGVLSDASACLLWLDVGEFFFPVAQQGFGDFEHACHFADAVEHLEVFVLVECHRVIVSLVCS